jgi:predicted ribosomally synthesized peptide with SipW-like signal peptide
MQPQILEVAPERPRRKRPLIVLVGMLVVGALTAATMSLAIFTDTASVDSNAFTAGKIDINATPASTLVAFTNQVPGKVVGPNALLVSNDGTGEMRYAVTSTSTNTDAKGLAAQLALNVSLMTPETTCATDPTPTPIYNGSLVAATALIGDPAEGGQTGDRILAAGASETLCFTITFPRASGNTFMLATTDTTFTFDAEQTYVNP